VFTDKPRTSGALLTEQAGARDGESISSGGVYDFEVGGSRWVGRAVRQARSRGRRERAL